jgi:hypothetical protein
VTNLKPNEEPIKYYHDAFLERLIYRLGLQAYYEMLQKIDQIEFLLPFIIERLEKIRQDLELLRDKKRQKKQS